MRWPGPVAVILVSAGVLLSAARLSAGPVRLGLTDARGDEVRAAARAFWSPLSNGNTAGAKAHFAGTGVQAELLEAEAQLFSTTAAVAHAAEQIPTTQPGK